MPRDGSTVPGGAYASVRLPMEAEAYDVVDDRLAIPGDITADRVARGQQQFDIFCAACHGADGGSIAGHALTTHVRAHDASATAGYIKAPRAPMPTLYPDLLSDQDVSDVAAYLYSEFAH